MRKGIAIVLFLGLIVGSSTTVLAQGNSGGRGNGGGGGDTPLIIVFRDAGGDLLRSDNSTAYIDGENIEEAILDDQGSVWLNFLGGKKGTAPADARQIKVKRPAVDPEYVLYGDSRSGDGPAPDFLLLDTEVLVGGGHISAFGVDDQGIRTDENIGGVTGTSWTTFSVFFDEPDTRNKWKLSYGSNTFDGPQVGEGLALVHCVSDSDPCVAWVVEKEKTNVNDSLNLPEANRTALLNNGGRQPDAGEYIMPFAFGICVKENAETEQGCRAALAGSYGF